MNTASHNQLSSVRYGVVGLGHITQVALLPGFKKRNIQSRLQALVSGTPKKLKAMGHKYKAEGLYSYEQYEELLESSTIDAVYIGLPNSMHFEFAKKAIERGIHVLCEKPLCPTERECIRLIDLAKKNRVKLMTAYRLHFDPASLKIGELIKKGAIGDPMFFSSVFSYQIKPRNIRLEAELAGGTLMDIGIYCINAARCIFLEEPHSVFGKLMKHGDRRFREVDGSVSGTLLFSGDRSAIFTASFASHERSWYEITGTKGVIRMDPAYEYAEGLSFTVQTKKGIRKYSHKKDDQFAAQLRYFSDCILNDRKVEPDGEEGLADIRIIEALHRSDKTGKLITLDKFNTDYPETDMAAAFHGHDKKPPTVNVESAGA